MLLPPPPWTGPRCRTVEPEQEDSCVTSALGSGAVLQLLLPKSGFLKCFQYRLKEDIVPFMQDWLLGPHPPPGWSLVP